MEVAEMGNQSNSGGGDQREENGCNYWTNERHLDFLSSMEETFVRNMMETHRLINAAAAAAAHHRRCHRHFHLVHRLENLRLDRFVPDISESTLDLKTPKDPSRSVKVTDLVSRSGRRRHRERSPTHPYKISVLDQVVPQAEDKGGDDKDEKKIERERERERERQRQRPQQEEMII